MKILKYAPYSFSKIQYFKNCPKKFYYQYVLKVKTESTETKPLAKGRFIHLLLEHQDLKKVIQSKDFKRIPKHLIPKEDIKEYYQIYKEFTKSKEYKWYKGKKNIYTEFPIGMNYDMDMTTYSDSEVFFRGYIDQVSADTERDVLLILDWKTGKYKEPENQDYSQLLYYGIALFDKLPFDKIFLGFMYVEHNKMNHKILHRKDVTRYKAALHTTIDKIETCKDFIKEESKLCEYCPFFEMCQADDEGLPWD